MHKLFIFSNYIQLKIYIFIFYSISRQQYPLNATHWRRRFRNAFSLQMSVKNFFKNFLSWRIFFLWHNRLKGLNSCITEWCQSTHLWFLLVLLGIRPFRCSHLVHLRRSVHRPIGALEIQHKFLAPGLEAVISPKSKQACIYFWHRSMKTNSPCRGHSVAEELSWSIYSETDCDEWNSVERHRKSALKQRLMQIIWKWVTTIVTLKLHIVAVQDMHSPLLTFHPRPARL